MGQPCTRRWLDCLVGTKEPSSTLKEITKYMLSGYEQHTVVAECQELVLHIIRCLSYWATRSSATTAAILDTVNILSFSTRGQKALIACGACDALSGIMTQQVAAELEAGLPKRKRQRLQGESPQWLLIVQLLTTLLLESAHRPAPCTLAAASAAAAYSTLQQVMHGPLFTRLCTDDQQAVAVVTARLAMEPAVYQNLLQPSHSHQQQTVGSSSAGHQAGSFNSLLGVQQTAEHFLLSYWETGPCCWSVSGSVEGEGSTATGTSQASLAVGLMAAVTEEDLFEQLLPTTHHCPIMNFEESDPVQVLHDLYQQKQLLQPLQCNHDLRLIRAAAGPSAASMPLADTVNSAEPTPANVCTTSGTLTEQVLVLPGSISAADIQSAVSGGFSLVLKDMPKRSRAVAAIVDGLEKQLGLPAGANLYYTPAGAQGLKVHYDDHCVFVLQLSGQKNWTIAPPQHCQLPFTYSQRLPVSLPASAQSGDGCAQTGLAGAQQGRSCVLQEILLQPASCLYIPRGWVHQAVTLSGRAASQTGAAEAAAAQTPEQAVSAPVQWVGASTTSQQLPVGVCNSSCCNDNQIQQSGMSSAAKGSLHLSVGLEVEAWFSVQGFLHCWIQTGFLQCMAQCVEGTFQVHSQGMPAVGSAASTEPGNGEAAGAQAAAAATTCQQSLCIAHAAAALSAHQLLAQHAHQNNAFRRACPLLVRDSKCRQAVESAFVQQLSTGCKLQQHNQQQLEWSEWALQHVLQGAPRRSCAVQGFGSLQIALQHAVASNPINSVSTTGQPGLSSLEAGCSTHTSELPSTLDWIDRVEATALAAAKMLVPDLHEYVRPRRLSLAEGLAGGSACLPCVSPHSCAAGHSWFATSCPDCWSLAEQSLGVCKAAIQPDSPGKSRTELTQVSGSVPAMAVAAAEMLPVAWSHLLAAINCGRCRQATELTYCDEATRCVKDRQLVRYAHLCLQPGNPAW